MPIEEKLADHQERLVVISLITNTEVLAKLAPIWSRDFLYSPWSSSIANWCISFFQRHQEAPREKVKYFFKKWEDKNRRQKPELVETISGFLFGLSNEFLREHNDDNTQFVLDVIHEHINKVKLERFVKDLQSKIASNKIEDALTDIGSFSRVNVNESSGFDLLIDEASVYSAFSEDACKPLVEYPNGLGRFFGDVLGRDQFFAYLAGEKVGKTHFLMDLAWRGIESRKRVAYFTVGDMSENQIKRRFLCRAAKRPLRSPGNIWPYRIKIPTSINLPADVGEIAQVGFRHEEFDVPLNGQLAWQACEQVIQKIVKSHISPLRIVVKPNSSINVDGISAILREWDLHGWVADIVVIDYADILAAPNRRFTNDRDAIHMTWKQLRALSQSRHCLIATATQANRASYGQKLLDRTNISDDKRKLAEVNGMAGINVYGEEKENGIYRLNWVALREEEYNSSRVCHVVGSLAIGNPTMYSVF
jgi:hypothetical protein